MSDDVMNVKKRFEESLNKRKALSLDLRKQESDLLLSKLREIARKEIKEGRMPYAVEILIK